MKARPFCVSEKGYSRTNYLCPVCLFVFLPLSLFLFAAVPTYRHHGPAQPVRPICQHRGVRQRKRKRKWGNVHFLKTDMGWEESVFTQEFPLSRVAYELLHLYEEKRMELIFYSEHFRRLALAPHRTGFLITHHTHTLKLTLIFTS